MKEETKNLLLQLLSKEMEEEYKYRIESDNDMSYLKELLKAKIDLLKSNEKGIDSLVNNEIIKNDLEKYNIKSSDLK